jgi:hypothetical protein
MTESTVDMVTLCCFHDQQMDKAHPWEFFRSIKDMSAECLPWYVNVSHTDIAVALHQPNNQSDPRLRPLFNFIRAYRSYLHSQQLIYSTMDGYGLVYFLGGGERQERVCTFVVPLRVRIGAFTYSAQHVSMSVQSLQKRIFDNKEILYHDWLEFQQQLTTRKWELPAYAIKYYEVFLPYTVSPKRYKKFVSPDSVIHTVLAETSEAADTGKVVIMRKNAPTANEISQAKEEEDMTMRLCSFPGCGKVLRHYKLCSKCRITGYCIKKHQVADWPSHKLVCAQQAESRRKPPSTRPRI